jgi:hypothetical protein
LTGAFVVPSGGGAVGRSRPCRRGSGGDTLVVIGDDAGGTNVAGSDCRGKRAAIVDGFEHGDPRGIHIQIDDVFVIVFLADGCCGGTLCFLGFRSRRGSGFSLLCRRPASLLTRRSCFLAGFNDFNRHSQQHQHHHSKR